MKTRLFPLLCGLLVFTGLTGCGDKHDHAAAPAAPHKHEHIPPHGGTPVVLGNEEYHVEFVLDAAAGKLAAYVLDGELEKFVRVAAPSFTVSAKLADRTELLTFQAVPDAATGETSLFEAQAGWLKTATTFDATLTELSVGAKKFSAVAFNFPKGNDHD